MDVTRFRCFSFLFYFSLYVWSTLGSTFGYPFQSTPARPVDTHTTQRFPLAESFHTSGPCHNFLFHTASSHVPSAASSLSSTPAWTGRLILSMCLSAD